VQPNPTVDPVAGRIPESRIGRGETGNELAAWGATPARPIAGAAWFDQFTYHPAPLSNGLSTDREWYALSYTSCLIRGFCDMDVVSEALADEGVFPVGAQRRGDAAPKAMATIWFNVIHDSVCGVYNEVVLSFDVNHSSPGQVAFREGGLVDATWALQYGNFGPSVCDSLFLREGMGLVAANGQAAVSRFLTSASFDIPITMPAKTAAQNNVPRHYVGHLWKGLNPSAVQVWPWGQDDVLDLGEVNEPTGCEDHNGHTLLARAGFEPVSVTYVPRASALIELAH